MVTNVLIVFGLVAFDNALAVLHAFPSWYPSIPALPPPDLLVRALLLKTDRYDDERLEGLRLALAQLRNKSRSFYLASGVFPGRLRIDLVSLCVPLSYVGLLVLINLRYAFCRIADDLVDNATTDREAEHWIGVLEAFLRQAYSSKSRKDLKDISMSFPESQRLVMQLLPTPYLSYKPLSDLLLGFEMDVAFIKSSFPMKDGDCLKLYAERVAGTVAELIIELALYHSNLKLSGPDRETVLQAGRDMGVALQFVNIARDIKVDAAIGRVYIPSSWLEDCGLTPEDILSDSSRTEVDILRLKLLVEADSIYIKARPKMDLLPAQTRGPMKVAVESYMEIGRVLRQGDFKVRAGRATVPKWRRLYIAWKAL